MEEKLKLYRFPAIVGSVLLLLTFFDWPYGYYNFLRIAITAISIYYAYYLYEIGRQKTFWFWTSIAIIVLFNPIIPIHLYNKSLWGFIDVVVAIFFIILIYSFRRRDKAHEKDL